MSQDLTELRHSIEALSSHAGLTGAQTMALPEHAIVHAPPTDPGKTELSFTSTNGRHDVTVLGKAIETMGDNEGRFSALSSRLRDIG